MSGRTEERSPALAGAWWRALSSLPPSLLASDRGGRMELRMSSVGVRCCFSSARLFARSFAAPPPSAARPSLVVDTKIGLS